MKLIADQVRKAIFNSSVYASYDGVKYYASGINMQAIADELNAALGSGMNQDGLPIGLTISDDGTLLNWEGENYVLQSIVRDVKRKPNGNAALGVGECEPTEEYACSACGQDLVACNVGVGPNGGAIELDPPILFNYCPNCGRKVKEAER